MTCVSNRAGRILFAGKFLSLLFIVFPCMSAQAKNLRETTAFFPTKQADKPRLERGSPLTDRASASFAVLPSIKGGAALQPLRRRYSRPDEEPAAMVLPVCGQSADLNTLGCYNLGTGELLADVPVPGHLTTTPQFHEGAWYVGTSRGFFMRYDAGGVFMTPNFGLDTTLFHGPDSRALMKFLVRNQSGSGSSVSDPASQAFKAGFRGGWTWYATANAEFVGTPQFGGGKVFVLTANQSLNAYDLQTGKLVWGVRLAPEVQLRLLSTSLVYSERGLWVGTNDGGMLLLDPQNGQSLWRHSLSGAAGDRFTAVSAPALVLTDAVVVSNAESITQRLNPQTRAVEWTYATGSVVQPKFDDGSVYIAGSDGAIHKVDARTGVLLWKRPLPVLSPLISLTLLKKQDVALAAAANGVVFAVRMSGGELEEVSAPSTVGAATGDFFQGRSETGEVCLSYRTPGYVCWAWEAAAGSRSNAR
jgi:outer membrane protein assembly factor BamB